MQGFQSESDGPYASGSDVVEGNGGKFVPLMPISDSCLKSRHYDEGTALEANGGRV